MINPSEINKIEWTDENLEEFMVFCLFVAGKKAEWAAKKANEFINIFSATKCPLISVLYFLHEEDIEDRLREVKTGQYGRLTKALRGIGNLDSLRTVTLEELESIHGIGPKTARFFLLYTRENFQGIVLDTHVLKWLRKQGYLVPKSNPTKREYLLIEQLALKTIKSQFYNISLRDADLHIWKLMSGRN